MLSLGRLKSLISTRAGHDVDFLPLKELKLYAPTSVRGTLLSYYHDHPTAGHLGVLKNLARMQFSFFGPKWQ